MMSKYRLFSSSFVFIGVIFESLMAIAALLIGRGLDIPELVNAQINMSVLLIGLAATVPLILGLVLLKRAPWAWVQELFGIIRERLAPHFSKSTTAELVLVAMLAGLGEEALFRGVLQPLAIQASSPMVGIAGVGLLFGLVHFITPGYAFVAGIIGIYLGVLTLWTDHFVAAAITHGVYDFIALQMLRTPSNGHGDLPDADGTASPDASPPSTTPNDPDEHLKL